MNLLRLADDPIADNLTRKTWFEMATAHLSPDRVHKKYKGKEGVFLQDILALLKNVTRTSPHKYAFKYIKPPVRSYEPDVWLRKHTFKRNSGEHFYIILMVATRGYEWYDEDAYHAVLAKSKEDSDKNDNDPNNWVIYDPWLHDVSGTEDWEKVPLDSAMEKPIYPQEWDDFFDDFREGVSALWLDDAIIANVTQFAGRRK